MIGISNFLSLLNKWFARHTLFALGALTMAPTAALCSESGEIAATITHPYSSFGNRILSFSAVRFAQVGSKNTLTLSVADFNVNRSAFISAKLKPGRYRMVEVSGEYSVEIFYTTTTRIKFSVVDGQEFEVGPGECVDLGTIVLAPLDQLSMRSVQLKPIKHAQRCGTSNPEPQEIVQTSETLALKNQASVSDFRWLGKQNEQAIFAALGRIYWRRNSQEPWSAVEIPTVEHVITGVYHPGSTSYYFSTDQGEIWRTKTMLNALWQKEPKVPDGRNATFLGVLPNGKVWRVSTGTKGYRAGVREADGSWRDFLKIRGNRDEKINVFDNLSSSWINHLDVMRMKTGETNFSKVSRSKDLADQAYLESLREPLFLAGPKRDQLMLWNAKGSSAANTSVVIPPDSGNFGVATIADKLIMARKIWSSLNPMGAHVSIWIEADGQLKQNAAKLPISCLRLYAQLSSESQKVVLGCEQGLAQWDWETGIFSAYVPLNIVPITSQLTTEGRDH